MISRRSLKIFMKERLSSRVSTEALEQLQNLLLNLADQIVREAEIVARKQGRKMVRGMDILIASKKIYQKELEV